MNPAPNAKIYFAEWGAVGADEVLTFATHQFSTPLANRLLFVAMARSNRIGHAQFGVGELRDLLGVVNKSTGELAKPSAAGISNAIASARSQGLLLEESSARCLQLPGWWQKAGVRESNCQTCGIDVNRTPRRVPQANDVAKDFAIP